MAEGVVVKEHLSEAMIDAGRKLTRVLDEKSWPLTAALWSYSSEANRWRLLFASPTVREEGPRRAYEQIQETLRDTELLENLAAEKHTVDLEDISVVSSTHPFVNLLQREIGTGEDISERRLSAHALDGHLVEDAYLYLLRDDPGK